VRRRQRRHSYVEVRPGVIPANEGEISDPRPAAPSLGAQKTPSAAVLHLEPGGVAWSSKAMRRLRYGLSGLAGATLMRANDNMI